ncbi:SOS response-associated peptidase [Elioraea tepidiphila]|jgi:putative SOS response-associated peptidase YedK|uniref:SOS response-associated peptidase n=1 Tax=Elioraea tepidiphila TaxID=457934 RepID=UPI002FD975B1
MCGRFAKYLTRDERAALREMEFSSTPRREVWKPDMKTPDWQKPRWNIGPSQEAMVIRRHPDTGELHEDPLVWGFVPRWTKDLRTARRPINARAETVRTSPMFRDSFERRRCLVPMDAFYEWAGEKPPKQPFAIARRDGQEMLVAGIWDGWRAPDGSVLRTFAVITTEANETLLPIHHRMPVIIDPTDVEIWLGNDADAAAALMKPAPNDVLRAWPVSRAVNDVRRDDPELLEPIR